MSRDAASAIPDNGQFIHQLTGFPEETSLLTLVQEIRSGKQSFDILATEEDADLWVVKTGSKDGRRYSCASSEYTNIVFPGIPVRFVTRKQLEAVPADGRRIDQVPGFPKFEDIVMRVRAYKALREFEAQLK